MDFSLATKEQLHFIATHEFEPCQLDDRYAAARELQLRRFGSDMLLDLVRMYPTHTVFQIADYLGIPFQTVENQAKRFGLKRAKERCLSG